MRSTRFDMKEDMKEEMGDDARNPEHSAVEELLPWYVNETLSGGERARVRRHLGECGACREAASLLLRVESVVSRPMATPILPPMRPERLLEKIDRLERGERRPWSGPSIIAAASLAIVAATLLLLLPDREAGVPQPSLYETVTSAPQQATIDYVMNLAFEPGIGQDDRQRVLRELDARDIRRDDASGAYHVNVTLAAASLDELERFIRAVEDRPEVRAARIVALQLPMQRGPARESQ
jgi:hypothetical protein